MDWIQLKQRRIPVVAETDVFVAGGGSAGVGAAVAAARCGVHVILAERLFCLGGMMTSGLMSKIAISDCVNGLPVEILRRLDTMQGTHFLRSRPEVPVDPECAKLLLDTMTAEESGVDVRFGTVVTGVVKDGRDLKAVIISGIEGEQAVRARWFIDCTGDGQLAFLAGAECMQTEDGGYASSPSLLFRIGNCHLEKLFDDMESHPDLFPLCSHTYRHHVMTVGDMRSNLEQQLYVHIADFTELIRQRCAEHPHLFTEEERQVLLRRGLLFINQPFANHVLVNSTSRPHWRGTDEAELCDTVIELRRHCHLIVRFARAFLPGFEDAFLMDTASLLGIRESRRIRGNYILTQEDIETCRTFDDAVCSNGGGVEIHRGSSASMTLRELAPGSRYEVPYRALVSRGFSNLFMAGRCFSATHAALSAARNIAYCCALGEACGTAAALLTREGKIDARDVPLRELQTRVAANIGRDIAQPRVVV